MPLYTVIWEIKLKADNPTKAAKLAQLYQQHPAKVDFIYRVVDKKYNSTTIDLKNEDLDH